MWNGPETTGAVSSNAYWLQWVLRTWRAAPDLYKSNRSVFIATRFRPVNWPAWSGSDLHSSTKHAWPARRLKTRVGAYFDTFCSGEAFPVAKTVKKSLAGWEGSRFPSPRTPPPSASIFEHQAAGLPVCAGGCDFALGMTRLEISQCLLSDLRPTTRECVHLVTRGYFRSRYKDGGHTIRSAIHGSIFYYRTWDTGDRFFTLRK